VRYPARDCVDRQEDGRAHAADIDSLSGKARKARQYGIPIIEEDVLEAALAAAR